MYDWIRTAPSVKYETKNNFGIRTLPPKPNAIRDSVSHDKNLNILGRTLSNSSRVKPAIVNGLKSRSTSNKSLQRLLGGSQEDVYPKLTNPVAKPKANLADSSKDISANHSYFTNGSKKQGKSKVEAAGLANHHKGLASDYDNNIDEEYDNFTYMDQYYMPMDATAALYDNALKQKATLNDRENGSNTTQEKNDVGMELLTIS